MFTSAIGNDSTTGRTPLRAAKVGTASAGEMFASAEAENRVLTWILRAVGFILMGVGLTIALGWIAYRPVVGIALPVLAGAVMFGLGYLSRDRRGAVAT